LAVGHEHLAVGRNKDPMRALEFVEYRSDDSRLQIDAADGVVLGVGEIEAAIGCGRDALRTGELRSFRGTPVAGIAGFASARDVVNALGLAVDAVDRVAAAEDEEHVAVGRDGDGARLVQRSARDGRVVGDSPALAVARPGLDDTGLEIETAHAIVADVADEETALRVEDDRVRLAKLRFDGGTAIAGESRDARAGDGGHRVSLGIDPPEHLVLP